MYVVSAVLIYHGLVLVVFSHILHSPIYKHGFTLIPELISNHMSDTLWKEITVIPHIIMGVIIYPCWD